MGVKRWLLLLVAGVIVLGLGLAALLEILEPTAWSQALTQRRLPFWSLGIFVAALLLAGSGLIGMAIFGFNRSLLSAFRRTELGDVVDVVYRHRQRQRGPRVVAIGGGHGLSSLLRGLKDYTDNITAIVTVADDGGSSGRLRRELGMLPPGDFRNCIAALSDAEGLMTQLFQYRFGDDSGLGGHSFGNIYLTAMTAITGSFESALNESRRVLAVRGRVIPSTLAQVNLCADVWVPDAGGREAQAGATSGAAAAAVPDGLPVHTSAAVANGRWTVVCGESKIPTLHGRIKRVYLDPEDAPAYPEAIRAVLEADLIVAGPGSLYTSVLPNLLVPDLTQAIRVSNAPKVYVCNVATQPGETDGYSVTQHIHGIWDHVGLGVFDAVLANDTFRMDRPPGGGANFVYLPDPEEALDYQLITQDLVDSAYPWRHDPAKLAKAVMEFVNP